MTGITGLSVSIIAGFLGASGISLPSAEIRTDPTTIDAAIDGLYASISGPKGQERDWEAFDALFLDSARMGAVGPGPDGKPRFVEMTPDEYKARSGQSLVDTGFTEKETHRVLEVYGTVAHAWSTYRGTYTLPGEGGEEQVLEGINSIQLVQIGGRWRVSSIQWESTQTGGPIPADYAGEDEAAAE